MCWLGPIPPILASHLTLIGLVIGRAQTTSQAPGPPSGVRQHGKPLCTVVNPTFAILSYSTRVRTLVSKLHQYSPSALLSLQPIAVANKNVSFALPIKSSSASKRVVLCHTELSDWNSCNRLRTGLKTRNKNLASLPVGQLCFIAIASTTRCGRLPLVSSTTPP